MSGWFVFLSLFFHTLRVEDLDGTYQPYHLKGYALYSTTYHMLIFAPDNGSAILRGAVGG
jgi:hypothetical protein